MSKYYHLIYLQVVLSIFENPKYKTIQVNQVDCC